MFNWSNPVAEVLLHPIIDDICQQTRPLVTVAVTAKYCSTDPLLWHRGEFLAFAPHYNSLGFSVS